jgi:membrane protein implicated in regulation of membrane protease activity
MACNAAQATFIVKGVMFDVSPPTLWLIGGLVLMLLELLVPGGIVFFIGFSASCVGLLFLLGVIHSPVSAFIVWFISSLVLLISFRGIMQRFAPATLEKSNTDEDFDAYNHIVEVAKTIPPQGEGRIHFRGL